MIKYVAFLDILGFKDMVLNNEHEKLVPAFERLFAKSVNDGVSLFSHSPGKYYPINCLVVSGSIFLWTEHDNPSQFFLLVASVRSIIGGCMSWGFPLRGAISHGDLSFSHTRLHEKKDLFAQTLIGKAIVNAYQDEKKQEWAGCIITKPTVQYVEEKHNTSGDIKTLSNRLPQRYLFKYKVPMKEGEIEDRYVVNWIPNFTGTLDSQTIRARFAMHKKNVKNWSVERKIVNTLNFIEIAKTKTKTVNGN